MNCPTCKKELSSANPGERSYFPFCSERCKLIDLGRWLDGKYQIPLRETDRDNATPADPPRRNDADID